MAEFNHLDEATAIRELAKYTEPLKEIFQEYAINYNVNIITGSMPVMNRGKLYNKGFCAEEMVQAKPTKKYT